MVASLALLAGALARNASAGTRNLTAAGWSRCAQPLYFARRAPVAVNAHPSRALQACARPQTTAPHPFARPSPALSPVRVLFPAGATRALLVARRWASDVPAATGKRTTAAAASQAEAEGASQGVGGYLKGLSRRAILYGGGLLALYVVGKVAYVTYAFVADLTLRDLGEIGFFAGGIVSTLACIGVYRIARRYATINPEDLYRTVLRRLRDDPVIQHKLGGAIRTGQFKAYSFQGGLRVGTGVDGWLPLAYTKKSVQLVFQMNGNAHTAMVSVHATKNHGQYSYRSLALDIDNGERVIVEGTPADVVYKGIIQLR